MYQSDNILLVQELGCTATDNDISKCLQSASLNSDLFKKGINQKKWCYSYSVREMSGCV